MRKTILIFCLLTSALLILERFDAFNALFLFIVAGVVPGTNISIPYYGMLGIFALIGSLLAAKLLLPISRRSHHWA